MANKMKFSKKEWMKKIHGKNFKYGSMSTVIVAVVVILTVLVNVGVSALVNRFPSLKLDMTTGSRLTLSQDMNEIVDTVTEDTEIIFCGERSEVEQTYNNAVSTYVGADAMSEGTRLISLAERAAERNDKISVRFVSLDENPSFVNEFPNEDLTDDCVIIRTKYRYRVLGLADMYTRSLNSNGLTYQYYSIVEYVLANALVATNLSDVPVVALATGHGEGEPTALTALLREDNFEITSIDLLTAKEISKDIDVLMICEPEEDFTTQALEVIEEFLLNDGNYGKSVMIFVKPSRKDTPNLNAFMADWGMKVGPAGALVAESDSSRYMQEAYVPLLNVSSNVDGGLSELAGQTVIGSGIAPMTMAFEAQSGVAAFKLLYTNSTAYTIPDGSDMTYKPQEGDYGENVVLAHGERYLTKDGESYYSRVSVCTSTDVFNYWSNRLSSNKNVVQQYFKYLTGTLGEDHSVYIEGIKFTSADMTVTQSQVNTIGLGIFTITIPVVVLLFGLVVWLRRRHL